MSEQISGPVGSIALVAALLVLGTGGICGSTDMARADDCTTAPNSAAPQGSHWYYHIDRASQRKCWYLRASGQSAPQAAAQPTSEAASGMPVNSTPAQSAPTPAAPSAVAPMSIYSGNSAPPLPHVTMLAVKPRPDSTIGTADEGFQPVAREGSATLAIPQGPPLQGNTSQTGGAVLAAPAVQPDPVPTAAADSVRPKMDAQTFDDAENAAERREPSADAGMMGSLTMSPVEMFVILALGLAVAGILCRAALNIAAARRERVIVDDRESDWTDDEGELEWDDDQQRRGLVDLRERDWIDSFPTERIESSVARPRNATTASLSPSVGDLQAALRVVMRERQRRAA